MSGQVVGAAVVWRDMTAIDAALMRIQLTLAGIIAAAAAVLCTQSFCRMSP